MDLATIFRGLGRKFTMAIYCLGNETGMSPCGGKRGATLLEWGSVQGLVA
jgi:hypothetical protein